ncbi:unnamed protein product, partial [Brenthis ino]
MILQLVSILIACLAALVYMKWKRVKNYWAIRNVPHLPPNPILGSLTFLMKENPGKWIRRMRDQFQCPYIGIWLFWRPCLLINSPEIAKNILVKDFSNFRDRFLSSGETDPLGHLNVFTINDPAWTPIRKNLSVVFSAAKLKCLQEYIRLKSQQLVQRIANEGYKINNLKEMYTDYTTDAIGTSAFGVESNATLTSKGALRDVTKEFSTFRLHRSLSWFSIFFFPELVNFFRFKFYPQSSEQYFKKIFRTIVTQREAISEDRSYKDLLDLLLKIKKDSKLTGEEYSDDFILAQAAIFLLGGYESTGTLMTYASYEIAHQPEIQDKLYQELLQAKKQNGSDVFETQTLAELPFLNCILKETLRKYPTMGWLDRIASSDYRIDDSLTIPAGTVVYINATGMHYDPKYFPDPDTFNPDRFLPKNEKNIDPYAYLPFGEGPRFCIGKRFSLMVARFALASVILNYKIHKVPNTPKPNDIKIDTWGLFYLPGEPMRVEFEPRQT